MNKKIILYSVIVILILLKSDVLAVSSNSRLVLEVLEIEPIRRSNIYIYDMNSEHLIQLTDTGREHEPSWSPEGTQVVYASRENEGSTSSSIDIIDITANTTTIVVTSDQIVDEIGEIPILSYPIWSSNGDYIAFLATFSSSNCEETQVTDIFMYSLNDNTLSRLTNNCAVEKDISWHPNENIILYLSNTYMSNITEKENIQILTLNDMSLISIENLLPSVRSPQWSHDGHYILFFGLSMQWEIFVISSQEQDMNPLLNISSLPANINPYQLIPSFREINGNTYIVASKGRTSHMQLYHYNLLTEELFSVNFTDLNVVYAQLWLNTSP